MLFSDVLYSDSVVMQIAKYQNNNYDLQKQSNLILSYWSNNWTLPGLSQLAQQIQNWVKSVEFADLDERDHDLLSFGLLRGVSNGAVAVHCVVTIAVDGNVVSSIFQCRRKRSLACFSTVYFPTTSLLLEWVVSVAFLDES